MSHSEVQYQVVVNAEEQYSIWPCDQGIPFGWKAIGTYGDKSFCLQHIQAVWTDLRPKSLRAFLEQENLA